MGLIIATSTIADGSMYQRNDPANAAVIKNREAFLAAHNITMEQTVRLPLTYEKADFCQYREVTNKDAKDGMFQTSLQPCDGLVTTERNLALFLPVADCVSAIFYDAAHHVLGLTHLGRHSLEQSGATKFVAYLSDRFGSNPQMIKVWLGPAPGKDAYPIWALDNKGMKEATFEQLHDAGILDTNITDNPAETDKDYTYFSYSEFLKGNRIEDGDHAMVAMMTD